MSGLGQWRWWRFSITLVATALAPYAGYRLGHHPGWQWWTAAIAAAVVLVLVRLIDDAVEERRKKRVDQAEADVRVAFNNGLGPVTALLGRLVEAEPADRPELLGEMKALVLATASELAGPADKVRASYFAAAGPDVLEPALHHGRAQMPQSTFDRSTAWGRKTLDDIQAQRTRLCKDVATDPDVRDRARPFSYASFLAVPVAAADSVFGMVTVDSEATDGLNETDVALALILADCMAVAISLS